ncbi:MAG: valine--tRNA ligase [Nitrospirae bacterium]|nr:valine--tRNA ligase [Nitrospirota bacterium]
MALRQLEKTYEPKQVEERWYQFWIDKGYFRASTDRSEPPYTIVIPPPNITGSLHVGHALNNSLQDILIRWRRMQGRNTLWMPGTDHAGIATQNVVERQLMAEGTSREALGREAFIQRVWEWKAQSGGTIIQQLKRLGASCDWDRLRFTMDEGLSKAVREVFVRLHEEGLIYRGERLINWCPRCLTALSDIEVEHEETGGKLYHIYYPLADDSSAKLTVATTRPETLLGDTAVAVHPEDPRYNRLIGKKVRLPLTSREIPIVGDSILVDREFGTGAVKITPAHDFNDFEAGERHHLPRLPILDHQARLDPVGLRAASVEQTVIEAIELLRVNQARPKVEHLLQERGLLAKVEAHKMALGKCYRCKTVVEPYLSPQWFVKIKPLAEPAIKAVEEGRIRLIPEAWVNNYLGWMRDIKDWCISRQIWWGHQIPAWYCRACNEDAILETAHEGMATTEAQALPKASRKRITILSEANPIVSRTAPTLCPVCGGKDFIQDPDVLDTWFSSALWPFSTLGWPEQTPELKVFYPTSTLVTGLDILFFWVARMIMMGLKFTGQAPFREVYIHALVRDAEGQKMSKSKGNVIDPLSVMERYGTDALRFTLASMASPGRDIKLAEERIGGYRNFANKIWNAARFILMHLDGPREPVPLKDRSFPDRWIMSRLNHAIQAVNGSLAQYRFDQAASQLYKFIWHEYCDWYLELIKPVLSASPGLSTGAAEGPVLSKGEACPEQASRLLRQAQDERLACRRGPVLQDKDSQEARRTRQTLIESFETLLRLLHPFMPFISEEVWQTLRQGSGQALPHEGESIVTQSYPTPKPAWDSKEAEAAFTTLERFVTTVRTGRALLNYQPAKTLVLYGTSRDGQESADLQKLRQYLAHLSKGTVTLLPQQEWPGTKVLRLVVESLTVGLLVEGDVDLQKALDRVRKQREEGRQESKRLTGKLANADFVAKAPPAVVTEHEERLRMIHQEETILTYSEQQLRAMMR